MISTLVTMAPALLLDGVALRHPGVVPARATALRMEMSDAEKARAYEEQVARAEAMAKDPSIRPPRKGLFEGLPGLSSTFGKKNDGGEGGFGAAFQKAATGWNAAVDKQRAINKGEYVPPPPAPPPEVPPPSESATGGDASDAFAAKLTALEAEMAALKKEAKMQSLEAQIEALKKEQQEE